MNYLVFDTETNGLPLNFNAPASNVNNWPRCIQLAWALFDEDENLLKSGNQLIFPDGWTIPKAKFWIDNGFSTETNMLKGVPISDALNSFIEAIKQSDVCVSHNMKFDFNVVVAEMIRAKMNVGGKKTGKICTKEIGTDLCKIPSANPKFSDYKWPKLEELHRFLFGKDFEGAHDAMNDVMACARCFFEMKRRVIPMDTF